MVVVSDVDPIGSGLRSFLLALFIAGILPIVDSVGIAATSAISAGIAWIFGFG